MIQAPEFSRHYEENTAVNADAASIFSYADNHANFSSHMNKSSWMMGGGKMETATDGGKGQRTGSHIVMRGRVLGLNLYLDEVITRHTPPLRKEWQTVGDLNLIIIDHYRLGFEIIPEGSISRLRVYIDYNLPRSLGAKLLGLFLGDFYARWCVEQMINGVRAHFGSGENL